MGASLTTKETDQDAIEMEQHAIAPRAFASGNPLSESDLRAAPLRARSPSPLDAPLEVKSRKAASGLKALGLETVRDLIHHLPRQMRAARTIETLRIGEQATVAVEVRRIDKRPARGRRGGRRLTLVEATVFDHSGSMKATFFNQPWLVDRYKEGSKLLLHGVMRPRRGFAVAHHALATTFEPAHASEASMSAEEAVAHYPATEGVTSTFILTLMRASRRVFGEVVDPLPAKLRVSEGLPDRAAALAAMHFPADVAEYEQGRRRLAFEELLLGQLALQRDRATDADRFAAPLRRPRDLTQRWLEDTLPFELTDDQRGAIAEIDADLASEAPMQRLLMGEVGSGKTVVALYAMLRAVEHGMQAALMAPTETLAEQHFSTLQRLAPQAMVASALLTGSTPAGRRSDILGKLASGRLQLLVGTHALIEKDVEFAALAVVVVDEQHRFGVAQRAALGAAPDTPFRDMRRDDAAAPAAAPDTPFRDMRGAEAAAPAAAPHTPFRNMQRPEAGAPRSTWMPTPHVLHLTATPIPRTLWLTRYGDLAVTRLKGVPKGRKPVATHVASSAAERQRAYQRVREELRAGRQAFVVCPLVSESEQMQAKAATAEYERLKDGELKGFSVGLLHGQMRPREKQEAMRAFVEGEVDVLVATTVIEVGIDVPNATVMLVEDAERYGISQLHQLRGRVGRGQHRSLCLLFGPKSSPRLQALASHSDGFALAEIDLQLRGEGDLQDAGQGVRQSGRRELRAARLPQDAALLEAAHSCAKRLLELDPHLSLPEHVPLRDAVGPIPA